MVHQASELLPLVRRYPVTLLYIGVSDYTFVSGLIHLIYLTDLVILRGCLGCDGAAPTVRLHLCSLYKDCIMNQPIFLSL
jgi:hypothetical protein